MSEPLDEIVETWVTGWARSRGKPVTREGGAWRVDLDDAYRSTEWVVVDPSALELDELARRAQLTPRSWVTVVGAGEVPGMTPTAVGEHLMRTVLRREMPAVEVLVEEREEVAYARLHVDGRPAAQGQAALAGGTVVVDKILTEPEFRRRGLGRAVMAALTGWALDRGATEGLLIASEDGFQLYTALGWQSVTPIVTFG